MNQMIWNEVANRLLDRRTSDEIIALSLAAEDSLFVRMNQAKVRQSTQIQQGFAELSYIKDKRNLKITVPITFQLEADLKMLEVALQACREKIGSLLPDPFLQLPTDQGEFYQQASRKILRNELVDHCLSKVQGSDFVGILTAGEMVRANINSLGLNQWFENTTFFLDFSLYTSNQQAVKGLYGGTEWQDQEYDELIAKKMAMLDHLNRPLMTIEKQKYRTYFSSSAVATLLEGLSDMGFGSREAYQRGQSPLKRLIDKNEILSPSFSLRENFTSGQTPRFNELGEVCDEVIDVINQGQFKNLLCSTRSAKEYGLESTFANAQESLRSPEILPGNLSAEQEMEALGTGLYVSDLHYLNWSNIQTGSLTGMTRFGCFWVENGKIVAPVKDMRFDESLYHFWGKGLVGFSNKADTFPKTGSYFQRDLGTLKAPAMLVDDFTFVL